MAPTVYQVRRSLCGAIKKFQYENGKKKFSAGKFNGRIVVQ